MTTKFIFRHPTENLLYYQSRLLGICFVVIFSYNSLKSQTVIYTQPFSGTLAASGWTSSNLTTPWGNGSFLGISNIWQVSDSESGMSANTCGTSGAGDRSLYMGASALASGAAYLSDVNTNRRISSANISTVGYTTVIVDFDFIGNGEGTTDKAYFIYSINGGTSWVVPAGAPTSVNPAFGTGGDLNNLKSQLCGAQGLWTHVSWSMPVSCEGITNLKVGFIWQSNNNSLGSDPSFAVDDVSITATLTPAPIELLSFTANYDGKNKVDFKWVTASESNNDFFTIEQSVDGWDFSEIAKIKGAGNSSHLIEYDSEDNNPTNGISYYRLKQTDYDGQYEYSKIVAVSIEKTNFELVNLDNLYFVNQQEIIVASINCFVSCKLKMDLFYNDGKIVYSEDYRMQSGREDITIPTDGLAKGIYILKVSFCNQVVSKKVAIN